MDARSRAALAWVVAGVAALLFVASVTAPGTGYSGMAMGWMWLVMGLPVLVITLLVVAVARRPDG